MLNPGDEPSIERHRDNAPERRPIADGRPRAPRRDGVWGEGTNDEMCLATPYMTGR
ncbi:hypothetical protein [Sorangium sp. So ce1024]|uniref:hypothetical protein n=1 Tax=unclassified Sorangium TaxID=2621164 RepID=UPI003F02954E